MPFSIPIDKLTVQVSNDLTARSRRITQKLFTKIIHRTPIDTGRTVANWNISSGAPDVTTTESRDLSRAVSELTKVDDFPVGAKVFLANGLPHVPLLEYGGYPESPKNPTGKSIGGFSSQAPQGMVRISMAEIKRGT